MSGYWISPSLSEAGKAVRGVSQDAAIQLSVRHPAGADDRGGGRHLLPCQTDRPGGPDADRRRDRVFRRRNFSTARGERTAAPPSSSCTAWSASCRRDLVGRRPLWRHRGDRRERGAPPPRQGNLRSPRALPSDGHVERRNPFPQYRAFRRGGSRSAARRLAAGGARPDHRSGGARDPAGIRSRRDLTAFASISAIPAPTRSAISAANSGWRGSMRWRSCWTSPSCLPGTNIRYGIDGIIRLIPVVGDLIASAFSLWLVREARVARRALACHGADARQCRAGRHGRDGAGRGRRVRRAVPRQYAQHAAVAALDGQAAALNAPRSTGQENVARLRFTGQAGCVVRRLASAGAGSGARGRRGSGKSWLS